LAEARAWNGLAFLHERNGDNRASIECADRAAALALRVLPGGMPERIRSLHIKGWALYRLGNATAVLAIGNQTLKLCVAAGDKHGTAVSYKLLGVAQLQLGLYAEADSYFQQGLVLFDLLGDRRNAAAMWSNRGEIARARGDHATAAELYEKALTIAREIGHRESELVYLSNLGAVRVGLGKFAEAERDLREVVGKTTGPNSCTLGEVFSFLGEACLGQGKLTEAVAASRRAVALAKESENALFLGGAWRALGLCGTHVLSGTDHSKDAELLPDPSPAECFSESLRVFQRIKADGERARTLRAWGDYELKSGSAASGLQKLQEALELFSRLDARSEVLETENLLRSFARSPVREGEKTTPQQ
jgi:tetratricopeptide (TPR) repeat protein